VTRVPARDRERAVQIGAAVGCTQGELLDQQLLAAPLSVKRKAIGGKGLLAILVDDDMRQQHVVQHDRKRRLQRERGRLGGWFRRREIQRDAVDARTRNVQRMAEQCPRTQIDSGVIDDQLGAVIGVITQAVDHGGACECAARIGVSELAVHHRDATIQGETQSRRRVQHPGQQRRKHDDDRDNRGTGTDQPFACARHISGLQSVMSEDRLRDAGAQQAERTRQYVSIASTAGAQDVERNSFAGYS
jgi:hypothetical protein